MLAALALWIASDGHPPASAAEPPAPGEPSSNRLWMASLRWENDTFSSRDRWYTDGVSLSLSHTGNSWLDPLADWLPWGQGRRTVGYELGQIMVTPQDISRPVPDPNDRPYAGILYTALSLHVDQGDSYNGLKFITGMVGPWSLAEQTQKTIHRWIGSKIPQGWDHQLHNEPILNLVYEHRHKFRWLGEPDGFAVEALPLAGGMLGNVLTQGYAGGQLRLGYRIPDDFGVTLMRGMVHLPPPRRRQAPGQSTWGLFVYGGGTANVVLRNITLDGNSFEDSPSVDKKWFVPAAEFGVGLSQRRFQASFSYVIWGKEFDGQSGHSEFGALTASWLF